MNSNYETIRKAIREFIFLTDRFVYKHHDNVMRYTSIIVNDIRDKYDITREEAFLITTYSSFHDIGKIDISSDIITKPAALTEEERKIIETHCKSGHELIQIICRDHPDSITRPDVLSNIIIAHHERLDGSGYPNGLAGDQIPIEAQIVSVADIFDSITSFRPYDPVHSYEYAFLELDREVSDGRINVDCVDALKRNLRIPIDIPAK